MYRIPNELTANFGDIQCRRELMAKYGDSKYPFYGSNEHGEAVLISIAKDSIETRTFQANGWLRVNYYGADGSMEGESFEGRWNDAKIPAPSAEDAPVSFDISVSSKYSAMYYNATKFVDTTTAPHCQAIHYVFNLIPSGNKLTWYQVFHDDYPANNAALRKHFNAMLRALKTAWSKGGQTDSEQFQNWIRDNCEHAVISAKVERNYTFALSDIALFYISIEQQMDSPGELARASIQIDVFNRLYITEDPIGAALIPACLEAHPRMSTQQADLAFASKVCFEVLSHMGDGPAIRSKLQESIRTLDKLAAGGK